MRRLPWTAADSRDGGSLPKCYALVPENHAERIELRASFEDAGVSDSLGFSKGGITGVVRLPATLTWGTDGQVAATITAEGSPPRPAWFWLVECEDGTGRRLAWWAMTDDRRKAGTWS